MPRKKIYAITIIAVAIAILTYEFFLFLNDQISFNEIGIIAGSSSFFTQARLLDVVKKDFVILAPDKNSPDVTVSPDTLQSWLASHYRDFTKQNEYIVNSVKMGPFMASLSKNFDHPPVNGQITVNDEGNLIESKPSQNGRILDQAKSQNKIIKALSLGQSSIELVFQEIQPEISLEEIGKLGILTLLGKGQSNFSGSPKARVHNISVGASIFNGILLKPDEEFSFNQLLGSVDASTGYQPELIIKNKTITPEYGGGLCQVSTTLFRAALISGLKILERHPHSLPVRYYNPQGFDATIYPGVSDLRFKNDTGGYILIESLLENYQLTFEVFGQTDGRKVTIDGPRTYDVQKNGAMKAILKRIIAYSNGGEHTDIYYSDYKSPSLFPTVRDPLE